MEKRKIFFWQLIKYGLVGVLNTLLTAVVIWCVLFFFSRKSSNEPPSVLIMFTANALGYLVGLINSFILNRNWTFKSRSDWKRSFMRFFVVFGICYAIQLGFVLWLNEVVAAQEWQITLYQHKFMLTSAYTCQLAGIVVFSTLNFLLNKYYTFADKQQRVDRVNNKLLRFRNR